MTLADLFDEVDILDISFTEFRKLIIKNKVVRKDYDFSRLKIYIRAYKKYMASDWNVSLREFTRLEGIKGDRLASFINRYGLDVKFTSTKLKAALDYKAAHPNISMPVIAKKFNCSVYTLYNYSAARRTDEQKMKDYENKINVEKAYKFYVENNCTKKFAEQKFSVYKGSISRYIKKLNNGGHDNDKRAERVQIQSDYGFENGKLHNGCR